MKLTVFTFTALAGLAFATSSPTQPPAAQPPAQVDPLAKDAEALPDFPKLDPKNQVVPLNPEKTIYGEVTADKKVARIGLVAEVCKREGFLEVFLCKQGTKEHEAVVRVNADAQIIHAALKTAGATEGTPTQFINPKTQMPEFKAATGTKIKVTVHYKMNGKLNTHTAQEWVWHKKKKQSLEMDWVFAGSQLIKNEDNPKAKPFYGANSGEIISISNFLYSMMELPANVTDDDESLNYEAKTDKIPPMFSKVWVILEPVVAKK